MKPRGGPPLTAGGRAPSPPPNDPAEVGEYIRGLRLQLGGPLWPPSTATGRKEGHSSEADAVLLGTVETALMRTAEVRDVVKPRVEWALLPRAAGDGGSTTPSPSPSPSPHGDRHALLGPLWEWKWYLEAVAGGVEPVLRKDLVAVHQRRQQRGFRGGHEQVGREGVDGVRLKDWITQKHARLLEQYEEIVRYMEEARRLILEAQESHVPPGRTVLEEDVAPRGDAILEFANGGAVDVEPPGTAAPVLRFRVSSHMLAEQSPLFASMFSPEALLLQRSTTATTGRSASSPLKTRAKAGATTAHADAGDASAGAVDAVPSMEDEVGPEELPRSPPIPFLCADGSAARLYRMPQRERNAHGSLSVLLHAAHMHTESVPRDLPFERFVAVASACLRYRCTRPLEAVVEYRWLPRWVHRAATDGSPDGLVVISYVFGKRRLFTRVTKSVILNLSGEEELRSKEGWPRRVKDVVWRVREAKVEQVLRACVGALEEYLGGPGGSLLTTTTTTTTTATPGEEVDGAGEGQVGAAAAAVTPPLLPPDQKRFSILSAASIMSGPFSAAAAEPSPQQQQQQPSPPTGHARPLAFNSTTRCPKGSHACDAMGLGWLMLACKELQLLGAVLRSDVIPGASVTAAAAANPPSRSLAQLVDALRSISSPPLLQHPQLHLHQQQHPGSGAATGGGGNSRVCDPAPSLRTAVNDVYNSVTGLTLFDVSGRHGWALSRHCRDSPQAVLGVRLVPPVAGARAGEAPAPLVGTRSGGGSGVGVGKEAKAEEEEGKDQEGEEEVGAAAGGRAEQPLSPHERVRLDTREQRDQPFDLLATPLVSSASSAAFERHEDGSGREGASDVDDATNDILTSSEPESEPVPGLGSEQEQESTLELAVTEPRTMHREGVLEPPRVGKPGKSSSPAEAGAPSEVRDGRVAAEAAGTHERAGDKFLLSDMMHVSQKTLGVLDGKQLRVERDRRAGLVASGSGAMGNSTMR